MTEIPQRLLAGLNPEQALAVSTIEGPLAVIAGPGSGKTRVLTHRIAAIIDTGRAYPRQILAVTFTNKAAGEMKERLQVLIGEDQTRSMWVCTFHSFCARLLRMESDAAGLPKAFSILDSGDVRNLLGSICNDLGLVDDASSVRQYASAISRVKNGAAVSPDDSTLKVLDAYNRLLVRLGALDFDDLLLRAARVLEDDEIVRARWQQKFSYVLVDEYQDTNPVQYRIVGMLAAGHKNLCVVGDADQAIYGFRSATPEALEGFSADWADAKVVVLEENYRSSGAIIEVCQAVIDPNPATFRPQLRTAKPAGEPVRLMLCPDDRDEARMVAGEISKMHGRSIAVLMRTNAQTRVLEDAMLSAAVPYSVVGALRFYERAEIKDAMAYLKLTVNPRDALALGRAAGSPRRGLGPKALDKLEEISLRSAGENDPVNLIDFIRTGLESNELGRARNGWEALLTTLDQVRLAAETSGPVEAVKAVLDGGLREHVRLHGGENTQDRLANLDELVNAAAEFAAGVDANETDDEGQILGPWRTTELFLERIALVSGEEQSESDGPIAVQLLTAHSSKGKEFDVVYVVGVEETLLPHFRRGERVNESEERRLFFVACSRAREKLTISAAERRLVFGQAAENPPSRFLSDLPASVVKIDRGRTHSGSFRPGARTPMQGSRSQRWGAPGGAARNNTPVRSHPASSQGDDRPTPLALPTGPRLTPEQVAAGTKVKHASFGEGVVRELGGATDDPIVTIAFRGQQRQFRLALAPLELLD